MLQQLTHESMPDGNPRARKQQEVIIATNKVEELQCCHDFIGQMLAHAWNFCDTLCMRWITWESSINIPWRYLAVCVLCIISVLLCGIYCVLCLVVCGLCIQVHISVCMFVYASICLPVLNCKLSSTIIMESIGMWQASNDIYLLALHNGNLNQYMYFSHQICIISQY